MTSMNDLLAEADDRTGGPCDDACAVSARNAAGEQQAASTIPPAIAEAMALVMAATGAGRARVSAGDLLARCERVVGDGLTSSLATGVAILVIRSRRLYERQGYKTFEKYLKDRWGGFSRTRVTQLMQAAKVLVLCYKCNKFSVLPMNEGQIRELRRVKVVADRYEVWRRVIGSTAPQDITAAIVLKQVLAVLNERAAQTPERPDPDDATLGDPIVETIEAKPSHDMPHAESAADSDFAGPPGQTEEKSHADSGPKAPVTVEDHRGPFDEIELTDRCFAQSNPVAVIFAMMVDGHDYPQPASWPLSQDQLVAAYVFQTPSRDEQQSRRASARQDPADAAKGGMAAIVHDFTTLQMAGVIERCDGQEHAYCLSRPGMELAAAATAADTKDSSEREQE